MSRKRGKSAKKEIIQVKDGVIVRMIKDCIVGQYEEGGTLVKLSNHISSEKTEHFMLFR